MDLTEEEMQTIQRLLTRRTMAQCTTDGPRWQRNFTPSELALLDAWDTYEAKQRESEAARLLQKIKAMEGVKQ